MVERPYATLVVSGLFGVTFAELLFTEKFGLPTDFPSHFYLKHYLHVYRVV